MVKKVGTPKSTHGFAPCPCQYENLKFENPVKNLKRALPDVAPALQRVSKLATALVSRFYPYSIFRSLRDSWTLYLYDSDLLPSRFIIMVIGGPFYAFRRTGVLIQGQSSGFDNLLTP